MGLKVWYGVAKQNKVRKKRAIEVLYENCNMTRARTLNFVNRMITIVYERVQTEEEETDAKFSNRVITNYRMFIDDKNFKGSFEKAIAHNFEIEVNHVSEVERQKIADALRFQFKLQYPMHKEPLSIITED